MESRSDGIICFLPGEYRGKKGIMQYRLAGATMIFFVGVFNKFTQVSGFTNRIFAKAQGTSAACTSNYILHFINFQDTRIINGSALRLENN